MKYIFFANTDWYLYNFRLSLIETLRNKGIDVVLLSPPGKYGLMLRERGFRWIELPMNRRSLNPLSEMKLMFYLILLYKSERPDLVHHFTIKCVVYGSIASRIAGVKSVVNAVTGLGHVFTDMGWRARMLKPFVALLLRLVCNAGNSRLIMQNRDDYSLFVDNSLADSASIHIIRGSGVNTDIFVPVKKSNSEKGLFTVILATRLLWEKGVGEYMKAAEIIKNNNLNIKFIIAGSGDEGNPSSVSEDDIMRMHDKGVLEYIGHVEDVLSLLKRADLVILPSYREGTPKILLEAASCGLPIITTDVPGCREVVEHKVNGLLVPVKDVESIAEGIEFFYNNRETAMIMGKAGRNKVLREFDERIIINATCEVYEEVL